MSVVITIDDIRAYSEVDYIINHMNIKYKEKVPEKILVFFESLKDPNYEVKINPYIPLEKQGLKRYTLEIIALLHLKYWCEDEERKKELYDIMLSNQEKLEEQMRQKFNLDNLFQSNTTTEENNTAEDFSRPKSVQKYNQFTQQNPDIQDYTDVETINQTETDEDNNLPSQEKKGLFQKIKDKIFSIFNKNK